MNDPQEELDRLGDAIVPFLCERTGLSRAQIESVLDAQQTFWEGRLSVLGFLFLPGEDEDG